MNATYFGICALALAIGACAQETPRASQTAAPSFPSTTAAAPADTGSMASQTTATSDPAPGGAAAAPAGAVNPPHGQPGHTCDIPVGAPLSSAPGAAAKPAAAPITVGAAAPAAPAVTSTKPSTGAPATATAPAASGVRINPPHGQPGHSCDVNVGDPLPGQ